MSGVKHTPGRWKLDVIPSGGRFGAAAGRAYGVSSTNAIGLSVPVVVWRGIARPASSEGQANARLIAAAPDHHAVALELDRLMLVIDSAVRFADPTFKDEVQALLRANKRAIARARGEQDGGGHEAA
ncbi:hypothetical protein [Brevundimonas diminuta]|uniref:hypothetical protein n=1 Tax=Brevundimonas diminuta TaxID=293 RepID=UPI003D9A8AF5